MTVATKPKDPLSPAAKLRKARAKANREKHEGALAVMIKALNLPVPVREFRFAAAALGWNLDEDSTKANNGKKLRPLLDAAGMGDWKFDFCWPESMLALEIEGAPGRGRHTTISGFKEDCRKYNEAWMMGWSVLRVTGDQVHNGQAINLLLRAFQKLERSQRKQV